MAASIESRVPFLDHQLVEFAAALPPRLKLRGFTTKWILREAVRSILPAEILSRQKMGFPVPFGLWMRGGWNDMARDVLLDSRARQRGIIDAGEVERLLAAHRSGAAEGGDAIWSLLNLELWYRTFIDGDGVQTLPDVKAVATAARRARGHRARRATVKLLWLNAGLLLPLDKGGKLRTWHLMRHLAARHDITYLSFLGPVADRGAPRRHARGLPAARNGAAHRSGERHAALLRGRRPLPRRPGALCGGQVPLGRLCRTRAGTAATGALRRGRLRLPAAGREPAAPAAVPRHPLHAQRRGGDLAPARRDGDQPGRAPPARPAVAAHAALRARRARALRSRARRVGGRRRDTFERLYPAHCAAPVHVVQTGVDTQYFSPCPPTPARRAHLVFTGSMDWLPNEDGMLYFVRDILPHVRQAEPEATLSIIGRAPTPAVRKLAEQHGVEVTGSVDDVRPHIAARHRLRRPAAHRRRHAAEDLRGDGAWPRPSSRPRSAPKACR